MKASLSALCLVALCLSCGGSFATQTADVEYEAVAEEYIKTYLAAHPLEGTALGLHEYDGKITDYSRLALDAELSRLRRFDDRLTKFDPGTLSPRQSVDLRILQAAVKKDLFEMQDMSVYERNPMVYARAVDVNVYIKRNFAPLDDRVRSLVSIESQIPNILIAARTNLQEVLPKPYVELAIQIAKGSADFLKKDLVAAVAGLKDEQIRVAFQESNRKAANALTDYAVWLEREKLPKASLDFALGQEKFRRLLTQTELVDLPPQFRFFVFRFHDALTGVEHGMAQSAAPEPTRSAGSLQWCWRPTRTACCGRGTCRARSSRRSARWRRRRPTSRASPCPR